MYFANSALCHVLRLNYGPVATLHVLLTLLRKLLSHAAFRWYFSLNYARSNGSQIFSRRATKIVTFLANKPAICSKSEKMAIKMLLSTKFACLEVDLLWEIRM